jgi:hypothetical protein
MVRVKSEVVLLQELVRSLQLVVGTGLSIVQMNKLSMIIKNPNPFKIISLQPTRKENNRETEETMERATVTLETERAKWPNPGCL